MQNGSGLMKWNDCTTHVLTAGALDIPASEKRQPLVDNEALRSEANGAEISDGSEGSNRLKKTIRYKQAVATVGIISFPIICPAIVNHTFVRIG